MVQTSFKEWVKSVKRKHWHKVTLLCLQHTHTQECLLDSAVHHGKCDIHWATSLGCQIHLLVESQAQHWLFNEVNICQCVTGHMITGNVCYTNGWMSTMPLSSQKTYQYSHHNMYSNTWQFINHAMWWVDTELINYQYQSIHHNLARQWYRHTLSVTLIMDPWSAFCKPKN